MWLTKQHKKKKVKKHLKLVTYLKEKLNESGFMQNIFI